MLNSVIDDTEFTDVHVLSKSAWSDVQQRHLLDDIRTSVHIYNIYMYVCMYEINSIHCSQGRQIKRTHQRRLPAYWRCHAEEYPGFEGQNI